MHCAYCIDKHRLLFGSIVDESESKFLCFDISKIAQDEDAAFYSEDVIMKKNRFMYEWHLESSTSLQQLFEEAKSIFQQAAKNATTYLQSTAAVQEKKSIQEWAEQFCGTKTLAAQICTVFILENASKMYFARASPAGQFALQDKQKLARDIWINNKVGPFLLGKAPSIEDATKLESELVSILLQVQHSPFWNEYMNLLNQSLKNMSKAYQSAALLLHHRHHTSTPSYYQGVVMFWLHERLKLKTWNWKRVHLLRGHVPVDFSTDVSNYVNTQTSNNENIEKPTFDCIVPTITIDSENTLDQDDAITIYAMNDETITVAMHITNVAQWFLDYAQADLQSARQLYMEAYKRVTTHYLPDHDVIPMLPMSLTRSVLPLREGRYSSVITYMFEICRKTGATKLLDIKPETLYIVKNYTYSEIDAQYLNGNTSSVQKQAFEALNQVCDMINEKRVGAQTSPIVVTAVELEMEFDKHGVIANIVPSVRKTLKSTKIIAELSILVNATCGSHFEKNKIPGLFKCKRPQKDDVFVGTVEAPEYKNMNAFGVEYYVLMTSPIRRIVDLMNQLQLVHYWKKSAPHASSHEESVLLGRCESGWLEKGLHVDAITKTAAYVSKSCAYDYVLQFLRLQKPQCMTGIAIFDNRQQFRLKFDQLGGYPVYVHLEQPLAQPDVKLYNEKQVIVTIDTVLEDAQVVIAKQIQINK